MKCSFGAVGIALSIVVLGGCSTGSSNTAPTVTATVTQPPATSQQASPNSSATGATKDCGLPKSVSKTVLSGRNLSGCDLSGRTFNEVTMDGSNFSGANFNGSSFIKVTASGSNFSRTDFTRATFGQSTFSGSDFTGANLSGATATESIFYGSNFTGATTTGFTAPGVPAS